MNTQWALETGGDPLGSVQSFLHTLWEDTDMDGMLVPNNGSADARSGPHVIEDVSELGKVNPFKPLMTMNAARMVPELVQEHPKGLYGALLRPCEMRALIEMAKLDSFEIDNLLTISVDCLGTLPADEYAWRAKRKKASSGLAGEALQFARQGGILAYRYRSACQICTSPQAQGADLNIYVFGLPVRQYVLVEARDQATSERLGLKNITCGIAVGNLVEAHARVVHRLESNHQRTMERLRHSLAEYLPTDVDALVEQLQTCGDCQACMDVCPICYVKQPQRDTQDRFAPEEIMGWLVSCAGCGMCEQSCPEHLPLSTIFGHIREQLSEEFGYNSGGSPDEPLPLI